MPCAPVKVTYKNPFLPVHLLCEWILGMQVNYRAAIEALVKKASLVQRKFWHQSCNAKSLCLLFILKNLCVPVWLILLPPLLLLSPSLGLRLSPPLCLSLCPEC